MTEFVRLDYYSDPGHGWYRVKRSLLSAYGADAAISEYSYQRGPYVYLEEDQDATIFTRAVEASGDRVEVVGSTTTDDDSFIRGMDRYVGGAQ